MPEKRAPSAGGMTGWLLPALFWLLLWTGAAWAVGRPLILPGPREVLNSLLALLGQGDFWHSMGCSLLRIGAGFLLGSGLGCLLAVVCGVSPLCRCLLRPALGAIRAVPVVSFILLLYFVLPTGQVPVAVAALMALPVLWRGTEQGIAAADPQLLELAAAYGLSRGRRVRYVRFPAARPAVAAALETALGLSWKSGVAAEVLCQPKWAAGTELQVAKFTLDTAGVMAWSLAIVALCLVLEQGLRLLLRSWREGGRACRSKT